jgi:hypothetical protein
MTPHPSPLPNGERAGVRGFATFGLIRTIRYHSCNSFFHHVAEGTVPELRAERSGVVDSGLSP